MNDDQFEQKVRSLDDVDAPDQWQEIAERSVGPQVHVLEPDAVGWPHGALLVAAAVVVLILVSVGLLVTRSHDSADVAIGEDPSTVTTDPPDQVLGRTWILESLTLGGTPVDLSGSPMRDSIVIDLMVGDARFAGCNFGGLTVGVSGDRLTVVSSGSTMRACTFDIDGKVITLLSSGPTIDLHGDQLTLESDEGIATFREGPPPIRVPDSIWGEVWDLERLTVKSGDDPPNTLSGKGTEIVVPAGRPAHLDLTEVGHVRFTACSESDVTAQMSTGRLMVNSDLTTGDTLCTDGDLGKVDVAMASLLQASPVVSMTIDSGEVVLTLSSFDAIAEFREADDG